MAQSVAQVGLHIVFSTKQRKPVLDDAALRKELYAYMATILKNKVESPAKIINGVNDHVHIICNLSRRFAIMNVVQEAKTETSKWLKKQSPNLKHFAWQAGYGAFGVSQPMMSEVASYIEDQEEHHRKYSFKDEFRKLCERHEIELDEKYAWD